MMEDATQEVQQVRLYQPIAYASGRPTLDPNDPTVSFIGGSSANNINNNTPLTPCAHCGTVLQPLVQLHVPTRQATYQVVGCNRASCVNALFQERKENDTDSNNNNSPFYSVGGGGVFHCWKIDATEQHKKSSPGVPTPAAVPAKAPSKTTTTAKTNDWMVDSDDDDDDDAALEQQIAALEVKEKNNDTNSNSKPKQTAPKKASKNTFPTGGGGGLPCFELHSLLEPPGKPRNDDEEDDDDDDMITGNSSSANAADDAKIQQMLAKYMAEEEDEDILNALRGTTGSGGGNGSGGKSRERDERLTITDRALRAFTERLQRAPRQVVRYAPGGTPLWSLPRPQVVVDPNQKTTNNTHSKVSFQQNQKKNKQKNSSEPAVLMIPPCSCCGAQRQFEFQLMPSMLHVLQVDKHAAASAESHINGTNLQDILSADYGGMNWGVVAVYTCPTSSCSNKEELLVVQASVDTLAQISSPKRRPVPPADAPDCVIPDGQTFDAQTEEGNFMVGCNNGDFDDDETVVGDEEDLVFTPDDEKDW